MFFVIVWECVRLLVEKFGFFFRIIFFFIFSVIFILFYGDGESFNFSGDFGEGVVMWILFVVI